MTTQELDFITALEFCLWVTAIQALGGAEGLTDDEKQAYWESFNTLAK